MVRIADVGTEASLNSGFSNTTAGTLLITVIQYLIKLEIEASPGPNFCK